MFRRKAEELLFRIMMVLATAIVAAMLVLILGTIVLKGAGALSWEMVSSPPRGGYYLGGGGGILNAIIGSLVLALLSGIAAFAFSLPVATYLNIYRRQRSRFGLLVRVTLDVLWGIPSVVYGAFGFTVMAFFGFRASLLAGIIIVTIMIVPIMIRAIDEVMRTVPFELFEAGLATGATRVEYAVKVLLRQTLPGIVTAVLIASGRGMGDAAAVLFTAGFSDRISWSLSQPAATLPLAVFFQLNTPFPEVRERAYAAALVLTLVILTINIICRIVSRRLGKYVLR